MMRLVSWTLFTLVLAVTTHVVVVSQLPSFIMGRAMSAIGEQGTGRIRFSDRPDETARRVVRPSPDLLYSTCVYDVSKNPLKITTGAPQGTYWSVSFFADNTDNFFVFNDSKAQGKPATILLIGQGQQVPPQDGSMTVISAPSSRGLVLFRTLINDDARLAEIDAQRREARCDVILPNEVQ
ncbi:MAG: DUF1254 domain-containing protein [Alphaproteobacteria bacterium]|nr:DUF1254 domain-containing protein [Alphaproteobacteria bacterium]